MNDATLEMFRSLAEAMRAPAAQPSRADCTARGLCPRGSGCPHLIEAREVLGRGERYYIAMGHPGYNLPANNRDGYGTVADARSAMLRCERAGQRRRGLR